MESSPGIEAGFKLNLGTISVGTVSFINVSLNVACRLPFDNREALFTASIGRKDATFLISAAPFGGGGFLGLIANSKRIVGFEASFEYGGVAGFSLGPITMLGKLTTGIYVSQLESGDGEQQGCTIEGFFTYKGSGEVFGISLSDVLVDIRVTHQGDGSLAGTALFRFYIKTAIKDVPVTIRVGKREGKGFSGEGRSAAAPSAIRYAGPVTPPALGVGFADAFVENAAVCQGADWRTHSSYFDKDLDGFPA